jgi:hypothetical protein
MTTLDAYVERGVAMAYDDGCTAWTFDFDVRDSGRRRDHLDRRGAGDESRQVCPGSHNAA